MYKIQLFDLNSYPFFCSFIKKVYVDDVDEFEEHYMKQSRALDNQKESFLRSKSGECVADWWEPDNPELNVVQEVDVDILHEKQEIYENIEVKVRSGDFWDHCYCFNKLVFDIRWIRIGNIIEKIAKVHGIDCYESEWWYERNIAIVVHGNPFMRVRGKIRVGGWIERIVYDCPQSCCVGDEIESYVWYPVATFDTEEEYMEHSC